MSERAYNFSPGPAMLPAAVMQQAQKEMYSWRGTGMSIMEVSHRSPYFLEIVEQLEANLRALLNITDDYSVLFLHGGGRTQFSMIPMNLLGGRSKAAYLDFGMWGHQALTEAEKFCEVNVVASTKDQGYKTIIPQAEWKDFSDCAYLYTVDNETVNGVEFNQVPESGAVPLVSDMSSNMLTRALDINRYGLVFACAQKNLGPSGVTVVIVRKDLLERERLSPLPRMFDYRLLSEKRSLLNTPSTYPWYVTNLVLEWVKEQGGVAAMEARNLEKSSLLYDCIDSSDFYCNAITPEFRSRMNVVFQLADESLHQRFLDQAQAQGLKNLNGHRYVGGMRASIYNAMPVDGVKVLCDFMQEFARTV